MEGWSRGSVQANGLDLHYYRSDNGDKPPLLLLHGLTDSGRYWLPTARTLVDRFDVILLDQRGHGLSPRAPSGYAAEEMAEDAAAAIRGLGIAPTTILGHSMGGAVALTLAGTYPELVSRILLLDPALRLAVGDESLLERHRQRMQNWRDEIIAEQQLPLNAVTQNAIAAHPNWSAEDCELLAEAHTQVYPDAITQFVVQRVWQGELAKVSCPVLLIHGEKELGSIVDHELAAEAVRIAPNVSVAYIANAGHSAQRDQFQSYIAAVQSYLS